MPTVLDRFAEQLGARHLASPGADLVQVEVGLFECSEVPTLVKPVPMNDVLEPFFRPIFAMGA